MRAVFEDILHTMEEDAVDNWLRRLVAVNSFTKNRSGVNHIGRLCIEMFQPLGFLPRIVPCKVPQTGDHVFLTRRGKTTKNIIFVSHLDTVYSPEEEKLERFCWREEGGLIYGPGVSDIKGGTIVIYMVLRALQSKAAKLFEDFTWHILLNASEEIGTLDFPQLARSYVDMDTKACLVYELGEVSSDCRGSTVVEARKGAARFMVETFGRQAHSGTEHSKGANALLELADKIIKIENFTDYERGLTVTVGMASGGVAANRVPDYASCYVDLRVQTLEDYYWALKTMHDFDGEGVVTSPHDGFRCKVRVHELPLYPPWPRNRKSQELSQLAISCGQQLGLAIESTYRQGASDGCHFWDLAPTLDGLGPIGANSHCSIHRPDEGKEQESVERRSFITRSLLNLAMIHELAEKQ